MKQIPLPIGPQPQPRFDNFVPGDSAAALAHLRDWAAPGAPVYLWGPAGSGKSHLLRALADRCLAAGEQIGWFDAADSLPWTLQPGWSLVVIDRCEALSPEGQHAAFGLFVEAATHGVQLAGAGRLPPVDLALREDLRTRLGWGHVFALRPLSEAETRAVLRREADHRGIVLSDEVLNHVLTHFPRDLSHLMLLLNRLDDYTLAQGRRVTVPLLREMLQEAPLVATKPAPQTALFVETSHE